MLFWVALLALNIASFVYGDDDFSFELASKVIQKDVKSYLGSSSMCEAYNCCNVTATETCSISNMAKDKTTLVLPGGKTRCIFSDSTPFAFQVIPGDSDNLLFYFQGGGACWDRVSTKLKFCTTDSSPQSPVGIFDRENNLNAFKSYTIVHVLYCSGDVFAGNTVRPYVDSQGKPVVQVGLNNAQSALDWVKGQMKSGSLASELSNLVVMGCSAGSIGAQLWGKQVLTALKWQKAAVVPDSYAGVFPPGSVGPLVYDYGFCSSGFLSPELYKKCMNKELDLQEAMVEFVSAIPSVPYTYIQSKTDIVQLSFYIAIGVTSNSSQKLISPTGFYDNVNSIFGGYNKVLPNFVTYLVNGDHHCFTDHSVYYIADTQGPEDDGKETTTPLVYQWVNPLPLANTQSVKTACDGTLQTPNTVTFDKADNTYCATTVVPKVFVESY